MTPIDSVGSGKGVRRRAGRRWLAVLAGILVVVVAGGFWMMYGTSRTGHRRGDGSGPRRALPPASTSGGMPIAEALARRRSVREFTSKPVTAGQLAQLCWAAQGVTDEAAGFRTAPSAGALYPLTVFVVDAAGVGEYEPGAHAIREVLSGDVRGPLQAAAHDQPWVGSAPVCLVIGMDVGRTASKYGRRAERYCLLEAGHAAQNVLLQATALGLGAVPVGAFDDGRVSDLLRLPGSVRPVYLIPLGYPAGS